MALNHVTLDDNYDLGKSRIFPASTRTSPRPRCGAHSRPSCAGKASSTTCSGSILAYLYTPLLQCMSPQLAVRPEGANHQWRKIPPGELSIDPVADERLVRVTARAGAS